MYIYIEHSFSSRVIVECAFDATKKVWRVHGLRSDKSQPNNVKVVKATRNSQQENISLDEIATCLQKQM